MRSLCGLMIVAVALTWSVGLVRSGDKSEPHAVVAKAIKAVGGEDKLKKHNAQTWREKGTYYGMGDGIPYTGKYAVQWPDQFRMEIEGVFIIVLTKDKAWVSANGETKELTPEEFANQRKAHLAGWVTTLLPLKDKSFALAALGKAEVDKKPAVGVKVTRKDIPDVSLYFDQDSGVLVKSTFKVFSDEQKKEVKQDIYYQNYREVEGAKVPGRIVIHRDGKRFVEADNSDLKAAGKLDDKIFSKP